MNRRQAKKAYKKKHGYNPPKTDFRYHSSRLPRQIARAIRDVCSRVLEWQNRVVDALTKTINRIQTMPQDEFDKILDEHPELTTHDRALAMAIRSGGRET